MALEKNPEELAEQQMAGLEQLKKDYVSTFSSEAGKKVLKHLESILFTDRSTFPKNCNELALAFNEGQRYVLVHIKNMMDFKIDKIKELVKKGE